MNDSTHGNHSSESAKTIRSNARSAKETSIESAEENVAVERMLRTLKHLLSSPGTPKSKSLLLRGLATHSRVNVRVRAAELVIETPSLTQKLTEDLLSALSRDPEAPVRESVGKPLASWLDSLDPSNRQELAERWLNTSNTHQREVMKSTLERLYGPTTSETTESMEIAI